MNSENFFKTRMVKGVDLDESRFPLLKNIVDESNAKIVLSSTWRINKGCKSYEQLLNMLSKYGMEIFDYTPVLHTGRGNEIKEWLEDNSDKNIEQFIILDDSSSDMGSFKYTNLIQTSWYNGMGLMDKHVEMSLKKLAVS